MAPLVLIPFVRNQVLWQSAPVGIRGPRRIAMEAMPPTAILRCPWCPGRPGPRQLGAAWRPARSRHAAQKMQLLCSPVLRAVRLVCFLIFVNSSKSRDAAPICPMACMLWCWAEAGTGTFAIESAHAVAWRMFVARGVRPISIPRFRISEGLTQA